MCIASRHSHRLPETRPASSSPRPKSGSWNALQVNQHDYSAGTSMVSVHGSVLMHAVNRAPARAESMGVGLGAESPVRFFPRARCTEPFVSAILMIAPSGAPLAFAQAAPQAGLYITSTIASPLSLPPGECSSV